MITYNDIYEASRKERYSEQLQLLPKNFVEDVAVYINEKKEMASRENLNFSDVIIKTKKQLENSITLFNELILIRRKKILKLILIAAQTGISKQDFENMIGFEKLLFEELMKCIDISDKKINEILNGKKTEVSRNEMVVFRDHVDEFLDLNGEKMGPFEKGQLANIPKEIAKILVDDKKAEVVGGEVN